MHKFAVTPSLKVVAQILSQTLQKYNSKMCQVSDVVVILSEVKVIGLEKIIYYIDL